MAATRDAYGLEYTCDDLTSPERFTRFVSAYTGFRRNTGALLKELLTEDPEMPMAICAKAYFGKLLANKKQSERAQQTSIQLNDLLERRGGNQREKLHAQALGYWCEGALVQAVNIWEEILRQWPLDGLALRLAHYMHFYSGIAENMRDSVARVLPAWSASHPDYGYVLGMRAFGLEETGEYQQAEEFGRRAVELNPADAWSVHAVAHVMEMSGRYQEGIEWVAGTETDWSTTNNFRFHLYWHQALFYLERGEYGAALALYDAQIGSDIDTDFNLDMCNATSILLRLIMHGVDVGDRWSALADTAVLHLEDRDMVFLSLHYLIALLWANRNTEADLLLATIDSWSTQSSTQGQIVSVIGKQLAMALFAAKENDHYKVVALLQPIEPKWYAVGGSKAQMDLFRMLLLDAAGRSKDLAETEQIYLSMRSSKSHSSWFWNRFAEVLHQQDRPDQAESARARAAKLRQR